MLPSDIGNKLFEIKQKVGRPYIVARQRANAGASEASLGEAAKCSVEVCGTLDIPRFLVNQRYLRSGNVSYDHLPDQYSVGFITPSSTTLPIRSGNIFAAVAPSIVPYEKPALWSALSLLEYCCARQTPIVEQTITTKSIHNVHHVPRNEYGTNEFSSDALR